MTPGDSARLSSRERLAEIAGILATGYRRLQISREEFPTSGQEGQRELDAEPNPEAPCGLTLDTQENEVA